VKLMPFFASALFFVSALLLLFAPLPLLFAYFRSGRRWAVVAGVTNSVLVWLIAGRMSVAVFFSLVVVLSLALGEFLTRFKKPEKAVLLTLGAMAASGAALVLLYAHLHHLNPWTGLQTEVSQVVKAVGQSMSNGLPNGMKDQSLTMTEPELEEWKENLMTEFPSAIAVFALVLVWTNLVALLRLNPGGVREKLGLDPSFFRKWKAPEFLVWPTIASGFFLVFDGGLASDIALNIFKFLMAIYAIQGLSILSFFFDVWKLKGIFRAVGFLVGVVLMMPLVLSLGFFDLWFDFRSKFRQS
jgi:uncharacterized protein YybS (DUF2232 family)